MLSMENAALTFADYDHVLDAPWTLIREYMNNRATT